MAIKNRITGLNILALIFILISCQSGSDRLNVDLSRVDLEPVKIKRYEQQLFAIDPTNIVNELKSIQSEYRIFLNGDLDDTLSLIPLINYIEDTVLSNVNTDCQSLFPDLSELETDISQSLRYYKYYYPGVELPQVYTYISGFDYDHPVQLMENNMLIAIDMYLGRFYYRYKQLGLPAYMLDRFDREFIARDCAKELAKKEIDYRKIGSTLLDLMINEGKIIYFTKAMMPSLNDSVLMNYSGTQMEWAVSAEGMVWAFLLENEMLYARDNQVMQKFILESPFTSFFGAESPPRLGWFIGLKIVSSYMDKNRDIELSELMKEYDAQKILQESGYKPGI